MFFQGTSQNVHGLFIRMAQHKHAGYYECFAKTTMDTDSAGAMLTVNGKPNLLYMNTVLELRALFSCIACRKDTVNIFPLLYY